MQKRLEGSEWLFCWITEYPQSQGPWPWAQQIFSAEYDLTPSKVKLFFSVAKKTSKLSHHFALRDTSNLLRQPRRTTGPQNALELLGSIKLSILYWILMHLGCTPSIKRTLTSSRKTEGLLLCLPWILARRRIKDLFSWRESQACLSLGHSVLTHLPTLPFCVLSTFKRHAF